MTVEPRDQSEIRADVIRRYAVTSFERWMEVVERLANDTPSLLDALSAALAAKEAAEARIDATVDCLREHAQEIDVLPFMRALGVVA